ncbi:MAG TPA: sulfatase-like hydrolase/transferase [Vicinamibacteria bacterium]|nr:sulfatase-like hydrolase/transferase [Vicinamibacteria bacterium]
MTRKVKRSEKKSSATPRRRSLVRPGVTALVLAVILAAAAILLRRPGQVLPHGTFEGRNILFVTIDTIRPDRLGSYGSSAGLTPYLDRLASEGIRFEKVLAHVPLTLPAHASIFTSLYPTEHQVHDNGTFRLSDAHPTLATTLQVAGYETGAFVAAFVLDARFGLNRGFDVYDDYYGERRAFLSFTQLERRADVVVASAERWLGETSGPWFAWVHLFDPHAPYRPPTDFARRFSNDLYGAEVAFVDATLGAFLQRLSASGRLERTVVVVLGDHGESLGEHGERTHGTFTYDSTLRVPWILWARGLRPQVFSETVRQVDVMPTLLDLLGIPVPADVAGRSLRPYLTGELGYEAPSSYFEALNTHLTRDWAPLTGVVSESHKLIRLPTPELYDLDSDPGEKDNLYRQKAGIALRLQEALDEISAGSTPVKATAPDAETLAKLRTLGYLTAPVESRKGEYGPADDPKRLIGVSNAYDEATELFGEGRTEEAIAIFEDVVRSQPRSSEAHQNLAYALHQTGRVGEAILLLEGAVSSGISDVSILGMLGAYLLDVGDTEKAVNLLATLVGREPDYAEGHNYLAIAYGRLGRTEDSRREFERVLELDPSSAMAHNNLGSLALSQGRLDDAVHHLDLALSIDPEHAAALNGMGFAHARRGDMAKAIELWRRAVESDPTQFDALFNLAFALIERSPEEATPYLERFVQEAPPQRYAGDIAKARAALNKLRTSRESP